MDEHVEEPVQGHNKPSRKKKWLIIGIIALVVLAAGGAAALMYMHKNSNPLSTYEDQLNFPLYYPSPLSQGYRYEKASADSNEQILFFTVRKENAIISISEQGIPDNPPDLHAFKDFKKLNILNGDGIVSRVTDKPTAIILTTTTLITLTAASKSVPLEAIITTAENLRLIDN